MTLIRATREDGILEPVKWVCVVFNSIVQPKKHKPDYVAVFVYSVGTAAYDLRDYCKEPHIAELLTCQHNISDIPLQ